MKVKVAEKSRFAEVERARNEAVRTSLSLQKRTSIYKLRGLVQMLNINEYGRGKAAVLWDECLRLTKEEPLKLETIKICNKRLKTVSVYSNKAMAAAAMMDVLALHRMFSTPQREFSVTVGSSPSSKAQFSD